MWLVFAVKSQFNLHSSVVCSNKDWKSGIFAKVRVQPSLWSIFWFVKSHALICGGHPSTPPRPTPSAILSSRHPHPVSSLLVLPRPLSSSVWAKQWVGRCCQLDQTSQWATLWNLQHTFHRGLLGRLVFHRGREGGGGGSAFVSERRVHLQQWPPPLGGRRFTVSTGLQVSCVTWFLLGQTPQWWTLTLC